MPSALLLSYIPRNMQKVLVVQGRFELTEPTMGIDLQSIFFNRLNIAPFVEHIPIPPCCPKRIRTTNDRTKTCSVAITP
mgnify:FL=1